MSEDHKKLAVEQLRSVIARKERILNGDAAITRDELNGLLRSAIELLGVEVVHGNDEHDGVPIADALRKAEARGMREALRMRATRAATHKQIREAAEKLERGE
jgi:hypothetical protein